MEKVKLAGCVIVKNGSILLLHRKKADWYELPGGAVNDGETPEDAAKREVKEELLCDVDIVRKIGVKDFEENGIIYSCTWFLAIIRNDRPRIGRPEHAGYRYFSILDLSRHKLSPNMKNLLLEIENGNVSL
jgi:8-oxo-dGTP diphosphatase